MADYEVIPYYGEYTGAEIDAAVGKAGTALQPEDVTDEYSSSGTDPVNGKAIASAISGKADSSDVYSKSAVDTALSCKQDSLSSAQLNAANSGIDSSKVSQITINASAAAESINGIEKNIVETSSTTQKINGVTFWDCGDGTFLVNGTATSRAQKPIFIKIPASLPSGRYVLSGCPEGGIVGSTVKYAVYLYDNTISARVTPNNDDYGDGFAFDWVPDPSHNYNLTLDVRNGTTANNLVFKPMICTEAAWNASHSFQPKKKRTKKEAKTVNITSSNTIDGGWIKYSDGSIQTGSSKYTEYIDVEGYTKIGVSCGFGQFAYYDKNKTYISGVVITSTDTHDYEEYDIPAKAKYVRITIGNSAVGNGFYTLNNGEQMFNPVVISATKYDGQFRKLREGISYAEQFTDAEVVVKQGTYDLTSEFSSEITNASTDETEFGIVLKNGIHILFSPQSVVNALYTGDNADIPKYFAPFTVEAGGDDRFILEGLTINSQNTRYCVHDELHGKSTKQTRHIYRNCRMAHDNTTIPLTGNNFVSCIGGGCGRQTYVDIDGCEFKTKRAETTNTPCVSYHNAINATGETHDGKSAIHIKNSYFHDKGYVRATYYGDTTAVSKCVISGCSLGAEPVVQYEVPGASTPENFELIAFNNEIRTE